MKIDTKTIKPNTEYKLSFGYSPDVPKGTTVRVESIRKDKKCASGYSVMVSFPNGESKYVMKLDTGWLS